MTMSSFRVISVEAGGGDGAPAWQASLHLGLPSNSELLKPQRNASMRLLVQAAEPGEATIYDTNPPESKVCFHEPLLLSAAATAYKLGGDGGPPLVNILSADFTPVALDDVADRYYELHVAPATAWPDDGFRRDPGTGEFELAAPKLRAVSGAMRVAYANPAQTGDKALSDKLSIDWTVDADKRIGILGCLRIPVQTTRDSFGQPPKKADAVVFELTPQGVEFEATAPDPFGQDGAKPLKLRLRLVDGPGGPRLDLIGGDLDDLRKLTGGFAQLSRDLAARGGNIVLQVDARGAPAVSWPLQPHHGGLVCAPAGRIPALRLSPDAVGVRLLTRPESPGGEPGVAEMARPVVGLSERGPGDRLTLVAECAPDAAPAASGANIVLTWNDDPPKPSRPPAGNPDTVAVAPFSGVAATAALAERLAATWSASGALAEGVPAPYAFLALERGCAQLPLPPPDPKAPPPSRAAKALSAFAGSLAVDIPLDVAASARDGGDLPGLQVAAATRVSIVVTWALPLDEKSARTVEVTLVDAYGALDGVLWAGVASPSPVEILPPRDAGPAALLSLPLVFGGRDAPGWRVEAGGLDGGALKPLRLPLPVIVEGPPALVWSPHETLALVSSTAMTRTAESALRPSATRELAPTQIQPPGDLELRFDAGRLPRAYLPQGASVQGDGRWRWPWPTKYSTGHVPYRSSPAESAGVAMASLTLPGVEFAPDAAAKSLNDGSLLFSLRFDLPLLDELFANAKPPESLPPPGRKPETAAAQASERPPTALDLGRLSDVWFENARRLARARSEADRVALDERDPEKTALWHDSAAPSLAVNVRGLVEPYVWTPDPFAFRVRPLGLDLDLGAYCLGSKGWQADWYVGSKALDGLSAVSFEIDRDALKRKTWDGLVKTDGFASSSFAAPPRPGAPDEKPTHLHDARGLSLAFEARRRAQYTAREISVREVPETVNGTSKGKRLWLATGRQPVPVDLAGTSLSFWFRDLPMTGTDTLAFDGSGGLETGPGPDPEALNRDRLAASLYEWRLYPKPEQDGLGRFEFPLVGPLTVRPLRLNTFEMKADGAPTRLEIVATVKIAALEPEEGQKKDMVFAPEDAYGSGNLVTLTFEDSGGVLRLTSLARRAAPDALVFRGSARVGRAKGEAAFTLGLPLVYENGAFKILPATLTARLFGQGCNYKLTDAKFDGDAITGTCLGDPGESPLQLKALAFRWQKSKAPAIELTKATLHAPAHDKAGTSGPFVFERDYEGDSLKWLGVDTVAHTDEIDHDAGVVRITVDHAIAEADAAALFRGFLLPSGRLRGIVAFALTRTPTGSAEAWPKAALASAYVEFAFDADGTASGRRITALRHRHVGESSQTPMWRSTLRIDAAFDDKSESVVGWPIGAVEPGGLGRFDADPDKPREWGAELKMTRAKSLKLVHTVQPRLCGHELPVERLKMDDGKIALARPWRFRAVVSHTLKPDGDLAWPGGTSKEALTWTSLDDVCLIDLQDLAQSAKQAPPEVYAFMARYRGAPVDETEARIAGVVRRDLALAGFPTQPILKKLRKANSPEISASLLLTGSRLMEAVTDPPAEGLPVVEFGVSFVPQWIQPWAKGADIHPLNAIPQADEITGHNAAPQPDEKTEWTYQIAAYDAAAGEPRRLDGEPAGSLTAQDGYEPLIEARFAALVGAQKAGATRSVDQAFIEFKEGPPDPLSQPLFTRTLLALRTLAASIGKLNDPKWFASRLRCVAPSDAPPRREIRFTVSAWRVDPTPAEAPPAPAVTLLVADDSRVRSEALSPALSTALADPASDAINAEGAQRADAAMRAFGFSKAPRLVLLARVDASYLTVRESRSEARSLDALPPHVGWSFVDIPAPALTGQSPVPLRDLAATLHASPALGWPIGRRVDQLAQAQAALGPEEARRNERAWAGRARSLAWPAIAWETTGRESEMQEPAFLAFGQRAAFRRRAAKDFRSPPDRLSVLAPPRARAPTPEALANAFLAARAPKQPQDVDTTALAPLLPGEIEVTVTGQRPGAMMTLHEGVLLSWEHNPFDPEYARFGRPAARGPLIARQLRAPRSGALPDDSDLAIRRRTFVAADEADDKRLRPFKLVSGPAVVARYDRRPPPQAKDDNPHSVTLTFVSPRLGWLSADWNGEIHLAASAPGDIPARRALARIGLLPQKRDNAMSPPPHVTLTVGAASVRFDSMIWEEDLAPGEQPGEGKRILLDFLFKGPALEAARRTVAVALRDASADTPIRFAIRCGPPISADEDDANIDPSPAPESPIDLSADQTSGERSEQLVSGPPRSLIFDLPHIPTQRRWLPLAPATLAFGDPAYDRELGSPTRNNQRSLEETDNQVTHKYDVVLAADRAEYDLGATLHFAFWKRENGEDGGDPPGRWKLSVKVTPRDGGPERPLAVAGAATKALEYALKAEKAYAIAIPALREVLNAAPLNDAPARLTPGDRLQLVLAREKKDNKPAPEVSLDLGIVPEPALPPPAACYGLATLRDNGAVGAALFATAPLPQVVEFPDLLGDLKLGHVRRRALFLWSLVASRPPAGASLIKADRTGGGQQPDSRADFLAMTPS